ncbi:hypothetical protein QEH59_01860 [Coraliomargarita sp. SDUM461004]|uniref:Transposase n=2 Tax=Thalassobacterium sedimentorum TaxID=3041258 RepID=A0ABU1AEM5_9BACT|nr:hypothetical protein [Coraliomargarita sp. SDUM461004]
MRHSPKSKKGKGSAIDAFFDVLGVIVPSCGPAMRLVELGQQRPLKLGEKMVLFYNTPLCPHCNCNRIKFEEAKAKMRKRAD